MIPQLIHCPVLGTGSADASEIRLCLTVEEITVLILTILLSGTLKLIIPAAHVALEGIVLTVLGRARSTGIFAVEALAAFSFLAFFSVLSFFILILVLILVSGLECLYHICAGPACHLEALAHRLLLGTACLGTDQTGNHTAGLVNCPESAQKKNHLADEVQLHTAAHRDLRSHDRGTYQKIQLHGHQHTVTCKAGTHKEIPPLSEVLPVIQRYGCRKER